MDGSPKSPGGDLLEGRGQERSLPRPTERSGVSESEYSLHGCTSVTVAFLTWVSLLPRG